MQSSKNPENLNEIRGFFVCKRFLFRGSQPRLYYIFQNKKKQTNFRFSVAIHCKRVYNDIDEGSACPLSDAEDNCIRIDGTSFFMTKRKDKETFYEVYVYTSKLAEF